jgi:hypothetical protein
MRIIPPVGSQALIDYVINPSNANEYALTMLESIPKSRKRVEEMLKNGQQIVWGLEMKHSLGGL